MRANRGRDTGPELEIRRRVHAAGMRYLVNARPVPKERRTVDMLFRSARVVVLIDGCFWHGCAEHHQQPKTHSDYWSQKVEANRARDRATDLMLLSHGWFVMRFWEHEVKAAPDDVARMVIDEVRSRQPIC